MSGHAPASSACLGCLSSVGPALSPSLPLPLQSIREAVFSRTGAKCPDLHEAHAPAMGNVRLPAIQTRARPLGR